MRTIRTVAAGLACIALVPAVAAAQRGQQFDDSWYWGAKGGVTLLEAGDGSITAPLVGAEWLVTRSRAALYVSIDQSFFDTQARFLDPVSAGAVRSVDISDMRRYSLALMAFPKQFGSLRPYAGAGFAINVIQSTEDQNGSYASRAQQDTVLRFIDDRASRTSFMLMGGVQAQVSRFGLFLQVTVMPTPHRFLINGAPNTAVFEAGIRYNLTGAREKL